MSAIGRSLPRKEGRRKVTGQARYVDDLTLPGMLYGTTVRSPSARGTIERIDFQPGVPWDEFTVVTADDIPGANVVALITDDHVGRFWKWAGQETEPDFLTDKPYIRATQVCLRTQGRWQVVHAHFSSGRTGKRPDQGGPE